MARSKKSLGLRILFVAIVAVALITATVLVVEDMLGLPYTASKPTNPNLSEIAQLLNNEFIFENVARLLEEHPDWAEAIANYLIDNFDLSNLSMEDLELLCTMFPQLREYLGAFLLSQLLDGDLDMNLDPEPLRSYGLPEPSIDNGQYDPDSLNFPLFTVDSNYAGPIYIRSTSWGDYNVAERKFDVSPTFDGSTYVASPVLFASYAAYSGSFFEYELTFHMGSHRDYGMLTGDLSGIYYNASGKRSSFPSASDSRLWLIDEDNYTVPFYPNVDYNALTITNKDVAGDEARYHRFVRASYRTVPEEMKDGLQTFLDEHGLTSAEEVVNYLKNNYAYTPRAMDCPDNQNIVFYFLNECKEGTCTNFASAAMLLCRQLGAPTRFVTGYMPTVEAHIGNVVLAKNAHAWIEVFVNGVGWVRMDPTAKQFVAEPDATLDLNGSVAVGAPTSKRELFRAETRYRGEIYFPDYAYGDYQPQSRSFSAKVPEPPSNAYSWFTSGETLSKYGNGYAITISRSDSFQGQSMIQASYATGFYSMQNVQDTGSFTPQNPFVCVSDNRLERSNIMTYSHLFYPDSDPRDAYSSVNDSAYYAYARGAYSEVPGSLEDTLRDYLRNEEANDPEAIKDRLETYHYLVNELPSRIDPIEDLLNGTHTGIERTFTGAFVLLCRAAGYPARYVEGFHSDSSGSTTRSIQLKDSVAWAEVYYSGRGWVQFHLNPKEEPAVINAKATFTLKDMAVVYDGEEHSATVEQCLNLPADIDEVLANGHRISFKFTNASQKKKNVGNYRIRGEYQVLDHWGKDVTEKYTGLTIKGNGEHSLVIEPRDVTISTNDCSLAYNTSDINHQISSFEGAVEGHHIDETALQWVEIPNKVGAYEHEIVMNSIHILDGENNDVTSNYHIVANWGTVTVFKN